MTNREKFKSIFGVYAEEFWSYPKDKMLDWLQYDVEEDNIGDAISRQAAVNAIAAHLGIPARTWIDEAEKWLADVPSAQSEQQWIPIKTRPMTDEEKDYYSDVLGVDTEYYGGYMFDCQMPEDGQRVWVQTKNGHIFDDVCDRDDFIGLDGNGDWDDIVAWMPMFVPKPWGGEEDEDSSQI